ncbi:TetR/AcrR family transcriptional regulator [Nonomuraea sediminis]|uniref:TetR/AcrR family transcriptional regulator n=1 Tax=Nonomuraea sediminis TaxID=2835864 RepID=UPI001BDBB1B9|nr:TetR/AcrR family transcriptional regulator [Nonomuraea sediminis]
MSDARRRLLETASRLFYAEGIHTVGIDRIIAEAGVAKATFYHHFKAKDDLVGAYLSQQYEMQRKALEAAPGDGVERIKLIFERLEELSRGPGFRGCPFLNAAAEFADPAHPVRGIVDDYRDWFRGYMRTLLGGRADAVAKADFLLVMRDGVAVSAGLGDMAAIRSGIDTALTTIDTP